MPSFMETVAAIREVEKIIESIAQVYDSASETLLSIPEPIRGDAVREILKLARKWEETNCARFTANSLSIVPGSRLSKQLPSATRAITDLLAQHTDGLTSEEIQTALRERFQTSAERPQRVIASTLSGLRANGYLIRDQLGRYVLVRRTTNDSGAALKDRIVEFFRDRGNVPATTADIAKATGVSTNAVRAAFSDGKDTFVAVEGSTPNSFKNWRLAVLAADAKAVD